MAEEKKALLEGIVDAAVVRLRVRVAGVGFTA